MTSASRTTRRRHATGDRASHASRRAVIYTRVSSQEQVDNTSLETQEQRCREYCSQHGLDVVRLFREEGESAKTTKRTEFMRMVDFVRRDGSIGYVVVFKLDRFSRNGEDYHVVRPQLARVGAELVSVSERFDNSPSGRLMASTVIAFAQFDNELRAERTKDGMMACAREGRWTFPPPFGYAKPPPSSDRRDAPSLVRDPSRAVVVVGAFAAIAEGRVGTVAELERHFASLVGQRFGKAKLSSKRLREMLANPIYTGRCVLPKWDIDVPGDFEPLVSSDTFHAVQARLTRGVAASGLKKRDREEYPLRRWVRCGSCGRPMTASSSRGRSARYAYYACPQSCAGIRAPVVAFHDEFRSFLDRLRPTAAWRMQARSTIVAAARDRYAEARSARAAIERRLAERQELMQKLMDAMLRGVVTESDYQARRAALADEIDTLRGGLAQQTAMEVDVEDLLRFTEHALEHLGDVWASLPLGPRMRFQALVFPSGLTFDGQAIGTGETSCLFKWFGPGLATGADLASPPGFEPG